MRDTPWGPMGKLDYRRKIELSDVQINAAAARAKALGLLFFGSAWDTLSMQRLRDVVGKSIVKIPSASDVATSTLWPQQ